MSSSNKAARPLPRWRWQRAIPAAQQEEWLTRLSARGLESWAVLERPGRRLRLLQLFFVHRREAQALPPAWGGRVEALATAAWLGSETQPVLSITRDFHVAHAPRQKTPSGHRLVIPCGMAFGSGEHATTAMLLRALVRRGEWKGGRVLDVGTGSGVLALAARKLGARRIRGTDFDPDAVRIAGENERLNFKALTIDWRCANVLKLRERARYELILANLFSGILIEASPRLAAALVAGGELWLSGVLRTQENEVSAACRKTGLGLISKTTRGKWIMQLWRAPGPPCDQLAARGVKKTT